MTVRTDSSLFEPAVPYAVENQSEPAAQPADASAEVVHRLPRSAKIACLKQATQRLSPALLHIVHQSTAKSRDRSLAALVVLIYGPTPFGGANNVKDVATRYGMTEQNLHHLIGTLRGLLQSPVSSDDPG
jgi:hypothetical protein